MNSHIAVAVLACAIGAAAGTAHAQVAAPRDAANAERAQDGTLVRDLLGATVRTESGNDVGELRDLVVSEGEIVAAVLAIGGFAGVGEKVVAVPYEELGRSEDDTLIVARTESELEALPEFEAPAEQPAAAGPSAADDDDARQARPLPEPPPAAPLEVDESLAEIDPRLATGVAANEEAFDEEIDPEIHDTDDGTERDHSAEGAPGER